ncbi:MAG TPA: CehA/McbA family metallohydrolase, partial [Planctomycetota bacterium]|nr:CehA/McbA family metallohydrolase [Planctomycetota bacterium]
GGAGALLFPAVEAAPAGLAVRKNVVYSLSGRGAIEVPVGTYVVHASRGIEWSLATATLELPEGADVAWEPRLVHELDTPGWASGDFHLHTRTFSGHGDSNLAERVVSLVGEGVEFAVATDHDHHTDYGPTTAELGAGAHFTGVTGNEVSTPVGHLNAFPLDPARPPVDSSITDARVLFALLRDEPNAYGVTPVIQLNHPRWVGIDWFGKLALDPVTARSPRAEWSDDFDTLEVLNENAGWGYRDAELVPGQGPGAHSVLGDWFRLLNRGLRPGAVGNSDSHTVHYAFAGYPRNYVAVADGDPSALDPAEVAGALRAKRSFTTTGPFLEVAVDGAPLGAD